MRLLKLRAFILSAISSLLLTILLWNTCDWTTDQLVDYLQSKNYWLNAWILHHFIFALCFGLIPIVCFLIWFLGKRKKAWVLMSYIILCWFSTILLVILAFKTFAIDLGKDSVLLPDIKTFYIPYYEYWNDFLPLFSLIIPTILLVLNITHRLKLNKLQAADQPLDQEREEN